MTRALRLNSLIAATLVLAIAQVPAAQRQAPTARVVAATRYDVSPALRDIVPKPARPDRDPHPPLRIRSPRRATHQLDPVLQTTPPSAAAPAAVLNFEGLNNIDGVLPPDTNGDIGPNHYVQWVNKTMAVYSRTGSLVYGPAAGNTIWSGFGGPCESQNDGDPIVLYDHLADRWFVSQLAVPNTFLGLLFAPFYQCIAVSQTPDPTGPYSRYQYEFQKLNDYPKFGVWPDGYYMTMNQFAAVNLQYGGQGVVAFERAAMLAGQPARMIYFDLAATDLNLGGMLPSDLDGPAPPSGSPNSFAQIDDDAFGYSADRIQLWRFHADWSVPSQSTFTGPVVLPVAAFDSNMCDYARACIPQPGTTAKLDAMSDRLMYRLQYRNFGTHESLVVNHTVDVDGTDRAGLRWYEIRDPNGTPVIHQQGTFAPDQFNRWMGSAAMDSAGNLAIAYSVAGSTLAPSIRYAGRLASDPPGVLGLGENDLIVGSGSQTHTSSRWGDYSMLGVDPTDGCTFWATTEYIAVTGAAPWQTRIGAFRLPGCDTIAPPPEPPPPPPTITVTATVATATEAGPVNGVFTIARDAASNTAVTVGYTVSGTALSGSDYQPVSSSATIPAGAVSVDVAVVPINDSAIEPNETVVLSIASSPGYEVGTSSSATVTIVSDDLSVDLLVTSVSGAPVVAPGGTLSVTDVTKNQGIDTSTASVTSFYLSPNSILDSTDPLLGTRAVPTLASGSTSTATTSVTIPGTATPGSYVLYGKADGPKEISETNETNNERGVPLKIGPDLAVTSLTAPSTTAAGAGFTVNDSTKNQGAGLAGPSMTRFYLSANTTLDSTDTPLAGRDVPALDTGMASSAATPVTIPAGTAPGSYYLFAKADDGGAVVEHTETNNTKYVLIKVGPDLIVSSMTVPTGAAAGATISVSVTVKNSGGDTAAASTVRFYLSQNTARDASDTLLTGERAIASLAPGAIESGSATVTLPAGVTGQFYIIAVADGFAVVAEASETNNTAARAITISQ